MQSVLLGYFPKRSTAVPAGMNLRGALEIASVSECLAPGPPDWIDLWKHNAAFMYDSPETAMQAVPVEDADSYRIYAYKLASPTFGRGHVAPINTDVAPAELPPSFRRLGYDVVSRDYAPSFECSPLSCNTMAAEVVVNQFCLFDDYDSAVAFAERCGREQPEPGEYVVVEVWR